jgi:hypothetical protein
MMGEGSCHVASWHETDLLGRSYDVRLLEKTGSSAQTTKVTRLTQVGHPAHKLKRPLGL